MPVREYSAEDFRTLVHYAKESASLVLDNASNYANWQLGRLRDECPYRDDTHTREALTEYIAATRRTTFSFFRTCDAVVALQEEYGGQGHHPLGATDDILLDPGAVQADFEAAWETFSSEWNAHLTVFKEALVQEYELEFVARSDRAVDTALGLGGPDAWVLNASTVEELTVNVRSLAETYAGSIEEARAAAWSVVEALRVVWHRFDDLRASLDRTAPRA
ncbi:hypothetical protein [Streptomyces sp. WAC06614]|uniref:hypothetical protein n=1 Tax=Streptomyces sp. WAC06614 TaxID=2487416 RepID=UPI000F790ABE|nr:hypothetical protein [Streptomyces sp. WAC06614]RSS80794.1 hypothetical protein EF918_12510 [Streptomyces sp. WAC06614]